MAGLIVIFILLIPLYAALIWNYLCPEEFYLWGKQWVYNDELNMSETGIRHVKISSLFAMIIITLLFTSAVINIIN